MNSLALDTATEELALCLKTGDRLRTCNLFLGLRHSENLLPWIQRLLLDAKISPADLDLIACSLGPGSFTGLRIGLASAKGLARGSGCGLVGVSTLDSLAYRYRAFEGAVVPLLPSLRRKLYTAVYSGGSRISEYLNLELADLDSLLKPYPRVLLTGRNAPEAYSSLVPAEGRIPGELILDANPQLTDIRSLLELGEGVWMRGEAGDELVPLYLRKSEAEIKNPLAYGG